ncbi:MAG TPA: SWIM zinc finger family protein [Gemmataceae bacterium]|nr:SWIM zinc finger family protein [Gemmataceae bacterium]
MIAIDEAYVDSAAPNADAAKNGRGLVLKGKFLKLHASEDGTLLFGECQGSGKEPYRCSSDFARPEAPTHRCNCPSRQFPCKHCVGLMYAFALKKNFTTAPIPEDLASKREKLQARVEKKKDDAEKPPKQVNKDALAKKIKAQLDGIDILERLTNDCVRLGIGNMNAKLAREMEGQAKQLGNAYLPGAQNALHAYTTLFSGNDGKYAEQTAAQRERVYSEALDQLSRLHALVKQGRAYLQRRLEDPDLKPETESSIAAWLGHAWHLTELKAVGLVEADAELVQLAFNSHDDIARQEYVDTGVWMALANGKIRLTQNFRPYKAAKFIKSDDSFSQVAQVKELCVYPGDVNPRIRWEGMLPRPLEPKDLERIRTFGKPDFAAIVKEVKGHLKGPLSDKMPIYALNFKRLGKVGDQFVAEDAKGERLVMTDVGMSEEPPSVNLLSLLPKASFADNTLIARFRHDLDTRKLQIKPLSIVTPSSVIRLTL